MEEIENKLVLDLSQLAEPKVVHSNVLKYANETFYLLRFTIRNQTSKEFKTVNFVKLIRVEEEEINVQCLEIEIKDEGFESNDKVDRVYVISTKNFLVFHYNVFVYAIRIPATSSIKSME
jgi:hypothetical protein